jgi:hypothetical protein
MILFFLGSLGAITINEPELSGQDHSPYDLAECDQQSVDQSLQDEHLSPDEAVWLHQNKQNWEIVVEDN